MRTGFLCCDGFSFSNGDSEDCNYAVVPIQVSMMTKMCYEVNKLYRLTTNLVGCYPSTVWNKLIAILR